MKKEYTITGYYIHNSPYTACVHVAVNRLQQFTAIHL